MKHEKWCAYTESVTSMEVTRPSVVPEAMWATPCSPIAAFPLQSASLQWHQSKWICEVSATIDFEAKIQQPMIAVTLCRLMGGLNSVFMKIARRVKLGAWEGVCERGHAGLYEGLPWFPFSE